MRWALASSLAVLAAPLGLPAPPATGQPVPAAVEAVIEGKGWGHGVGMAQDGAFAMGAAGASTEEILEAFYPGTSMGNRSGTLAVTLFEAPQAEITVSLPSGGEIRTASGEQSGFPISVSPGGSVRLSFGDGRYHATPLSGATPTLAEPPSDGEAAPPPSEAPPTSTTLLLGLLPLPVAPAPAPEPEAPPPLPADEIPEPSSGSSLDVVPEDGSSVTLPELGRRYSGNIEAVADGGGLQLINQVDVERYLRGMGEVRDPGWPPAALRAQAIAARTYAMRAPAAGRTLCSTDQCQVYLGETVEYGAMNAAVADTEGQVLMYGGSLALTVYSASGGGISASPEEGFGTSGADVPYLRVAEYPSRDPLPWSVRSSLSELAGRFGYSGEVTSVRVSQAGPSGRAMEVMFDGAAGPLAVEGRRFAATLALRSTLFTIRVEGVPGPAASAVSVIDVAAPPRPTPDILLASTPARLGRPPWIALALLLIVGSTTGAVRVRNHRTV